MLLWRAKASMRRDKVAVHVVVPDQEAMVYIDSGEILREYNWGTTTNYFSIYTNVHVETTRLSCDAQPSISQLY